MRLLLTRRVPAASSRALRVVAALTLTASLAACSGEATSGATPSGTGSTSPRPSPSASPSVPPSEPPSEPASPDPSQPAAETLEVEVSGDQVRPVAAQVDLAVGEPLRITVRSDRSGELHVHADPERSFSFGSGTHRFRLVLATPGSVDIEEHGADALVARVLVR